jgi:hypothetical protein
MIPVYQTINNAVNGNCLAAVWASLLHLDLRKVPNFVESEDYIETLNDFIESYGLQYDRYLANPNRKDATEEGMTNYEWFGSELPDYGHINGFYEASVISTYTNMEKFRTDPSYNAICHAVIIDRNFNIVHDPNPFNIRSKYPLADLLGFNGVIGVSLYSRIKVKVAQFKNQLQ